MPDRPRDLLRHIVALGAPTTGIALVQSAAMLIETALAARQGTQALAGWAVILPFALLMQQMSTGAMGGGVVAAIARALGAGRAEEASDLVVHAVVISLAAGLAFALGLSFGAHALLEAVGGAGAADAASAYAVWLFGAGAIPAWLTNMLASVLRGGGRHALAARVLLAVWLAYPALAWLLAEPLGMGLAGVGAAFAAVSWLAALAMAAVVKAGGAGFTPVWHVRLARQRFATILSVGATACLMAAIANMTTILVTAQLRGYGAPAVAAFGISARLEFLMVPLAFGVGSGLTALVGRAVGTGDWARARATAWVGGLLALAVTGAVGLATAVMPRHFAALFSSDAAVQVIAAQALGFVGPAFGAFGLGMALYFAAMGAGRMGWPLAGAVARIVVAVGGGWVLAQPLGLGIGGHFLGVALGITAYGALNAAGVTKRRWGG